MHVIYFVVQYPCLRLLVIKTIPLNISTILDVWYLDRVHTIPPSYDLMAYTVIGSTIL